MMIISSLGGGLWSCRIFFNIIYIVFILFISFCFAFIPTTTITTTSTTQRQQQQHHHQFRRSFFTLPVRVVPFPPVVVVVAIAMTKQSTSTSSPSNTGTGTDTGTGTYSSTTNNKRQRVSNDKNENGNDNENDKHDEVVNSSSMTYESIDRTMKQRTEGMNDRAKNVQPFTEDELSDILQSIENIMMKSSSASTSSTTTTTSSSIDTNNEIRHFLQQVGHLSHKDWKRTIKNGIQFGNLLQLYDISNNNNVRQMIHRIVTDGNWDGAFQHATTCTTTSTTGPGVNDNDIIPIEQNNVKPWAVLVTGVNGIRKTTSIYQSWFPQLLKEALIVPDGIDQESIHTIPTHMLPVGTNSFFRQLDHIIVTLCNVDFIKLYTFARDLLLLKDSTVATTTTTAIAAAEVEDDESNYNFTKEVDIPIEIIKMYSDLKAAIFTRYRTISELFGAHLLVEAQKDLLNCMVETSGRDVAMFHYVDEVFSSSASSTSSTSTSASDNKNNNNNNNKYNKLALHYTINELKYAQESVDRRMVHEIQTGIHALHEYSTSTTGTSIEGIIQVNEGGPYGSEVLPSVQIDSERVWNDIVLHDNNNNNTNNNNNNNENIPNRVGKDWYKATIHIIAHPTEPWTAQAVRPDGSLGTVFTFERRT